MTQKLRRLSLCTNDKIDIKVRQISQLMKLDIRKVNEPFPKFSYKVRDNFTGEIYVRSSLIALVTDDGSNPFICNRYYRQPEDILGQKVMNDPFVRWAGLDLSSFIVTDEDDIDVLYCIEGLDNFQRRHQCCLNILKSMIIDHLHISKQLDEYDGEAISDKKFAKLGDTYRKKATELFKKHYNNTIRLFNDNWQDFYLMTRNQYFNANFRAYHYRPRDYIFDNLKSSDIDEIEKSIFYIMQPYYRIARDKNNNKLFDIEGNVIQYFAHILQMMRNDPLLENEKMIK